MSQGLPGELASSKRYFSSNEQGNGAATRNPQVDNQSPQAASYRQGELIKLMAFFGVLVGIIAVIYDGLMRLSLHVFWKMIPRAIEELAAERPGGMDDINRWGFVYTILTSVALAACAGMTIKYLGFPGDLSNVIQCVHKVGYVPMKQSLPMFCCSLFSIAAGGSLGPEAPLVALSASVCGWVSMNYFKHDMVIVRKCTIMGMSAGLSALFGVQLGGAIFALEVLHTMGMQFFDIGVYAVGAGGVCLAVYRGLKGDSFGAIWAFAPAPQSAAAEVMLGVMIGAIAGVVGLIFRSIFRGAGKCFRKMGLGHFEDTPSPVILCALGGLCTSIIGVLVPPTMFWSEYEIDTIAQPGKDLPNVWPQGGVFYGLERYPWESAGMSILVALAKLLTISINTQSGFRGGFIFPLFFCGAAMGRAVSIFADDFLPEGIIHASPVLWSMCFAAGLNVAVTRTPFASPLILTALSGQPNVAAPALCASLASLFVTRSSKFIAPQKDRADLVFVDDLRPLQTPTKRDNADKGVKAQVNGINGSGRRSENGNGVGRSLGGGEARFLLAEVGSTGKYNAVAVV